MEKIDLKKYLADHKDFYHLDKDKLFLISLKALIIDENNNILVLKCSVGRQLWTVPGGLVEYEESFETGLKREVKEESGLEIDIHNVFNVYDYYRNKPFKFEDGRIKDVRTTEIHYLSRKVSGQIKLDWESSDYAWINKDNYTKYEYYEATNDSLLKYFNQFT